MRGDELIVTPHPFLEGMCEQQLRSLSEAAMRASFAEGEWIFREGEPAERFYLIHSPVRRRSVHSRTSGPTAMIAAQMAFAHVAFMNEAFYSGRSTLPRGCS